MIYKNLCCEGGGVKGIAFAGSLLALEQLGHNKFIRYCGTSAGAITALLLALGFKANEIKDILFKTDFRKFKDDISYPMAASNLIFKYGLYKATYFESFLKELIQDKTGDRNATFERVHSITNCTLTVIASNLSTRYSEALCTELTPDLEVWKAVRASMAIPFFFTPIKMKWSCKDGVKDCLFCDGGIFQNYPITYFDDEKFGVIPVNGSCFNNETLGLKLDSSDRIEVLKNHGKPQGSQIKNIISFTDSVIDSLMNCMDNYYRSSDDNIRTVYIDTLGVNTTQFDINLKLKNDLFKSGYDSIIEFFNKKGLHL